MDDKSVSGALYHSLQAFWLASQAYAAAATLRVVVPLLDPSLLALVLLKTVRRAAEAVTCDAVLFSLPV